MSNFDAIVIGSGMSGGYAAKELTERGLKVLVLERGKNVVPAEDYNDTVPIWERPNLGRIPQDELEEHYAVQNKAAGWAMNWASKQFFVKDSEHPYEEADDSKFQWVRGYHSGGRSVLWSRVALRLGPQDFEENKKDGHGVDWPVRYKDIAPWYDKVEKFVGIAGQNEGLPQLPDGVFQPPFALTDTEKHLRESVKANFPGRTVIHTRTANLTQPTEEQMSLGRAPCQARNQCHEGCSFKAYFSSVNATLPAAQRTGNLTLINNAIVHSIEYNAAKKRVSAVHVIDKITKNTSRYTAKLIFLNASTVGSAMILLQSKSESFPSGLANRSDQVGRNLMDHVTGAGITGRLNKFAHLTSYGRRPCGIYIPRYGNITEDGKPYIRGFGYQGWSSPVNTLNKRRPGIGREFKESYKHPAPWEINLYAFGEVLPNPDNRVELHPTKKDKWGLPVAQFHTTMGENERIIIEEARKDAIAMLEEAGFTDIKAPKGHITAMGNRVHEMGTARMGRDRNTSVLNGWCQAHDVPNLFITDGSFMASSACQNPSLTYMAFTARAANYAADKLQAGAL